MSLLSWRRPMTKGLLSCVSSSEILVSFHLHPYCRNCVRIFNLHGMDYRRAPLGTFITVCQDVCHGMLAKMAARHHTERHYFCMCNPVNIAHVSLNVSSLAVPGNLYLYLINSIPNQNWVQLFL